MENKNEMEIEREDIYQWVDIVLKLKEKCAKNISLNKQYAELH